MSVAKNFGRLPECLIFVANKENMKFQVGDKVKFLNEKGGGIVTKIITTSMVNVMVEDGFEIPTLTSELVKVDPKGKAESMFDEDFPTSRQPAVGSRQSAVGSRQDDGSASKPDIPFRTNEFVQQDGRNTQPEAPDRQSAFGNYSFRVKNTPGVYLAFVPHDQKWLVTGIVEIYLLNHTPFNVLYSFFLEEENEIIGKDYDVIFPGNKILVDAVDRDHLLQWTRGVVQLIYHQDTPDRILSPVSSSFDITPVRFNKEENYGYSQFFEEKALLISVSQLSALTTVISKEDSHLSEEALTKMRSAEVRPASLIERHQTGPREAVVDLHIEELAPDHSGLSPHEILKMQMDYFKRCIESAVEKNFRKVTFIHGVGNGTLKNEIIKKVSEYEHADSHLASLAKFGVGAIDVNIKPLK